jgi:hypothetical protein
MKRTIKDATVKRYHYASHDQLRRSLADFLDAYNFALRLKTVIGLTPYEYICRIWTPEPDRFLLNPIHHTPRLNTQSRDLHQACVLRVGSITERCTDELLNFFANPFS